MFCEPVFFRFDLPNSFFRQHRQSWNIQNYGIYELKYYCKNHLKEVQKISTPTTVISGQVSFVPAPIKEETGQKGATPDHIAQRFRGFSQGGEKCVSCGKNVYLNEKLLIGETTKQSIYHKSCFRCSHCHIQVDVATYGSVGGVIYCKTHLKTVGRVEPTKSNNAYFISPLANTKSDYVPTAVQIDQANSDTVVYSHNEDSMKEITPSNIETTTTSTQAQPAQLAQVKQTKQEPQVVEEKLENLSIQQNNENSSSSSASDYGDMTEEQRRVERQRKKEERLKQIEMEEKQREEERNRRKAEINSLRSDYNSTGGETSPSLGSSTDRETERQKRREERERKEKEAEEERKKRAEERTKKRLSAIDN